MKKNYKKKNRANSVDMNKNKNRQVELKIGNTSFSEKLPMLTHIHFTQIITKILVLIRLS